jgi:hypothetical protein
MKRKGLLFLVLATLVVGRAFAQKAGDTGDFMGKNYTVQEARDGRLVLQLTPTLDGTWKSEGGNVMTFNGNSAVFKQMVSTGVVGSAVSKGFIKVGDQSWRNLKKTDGLTWSGQSLMFRFNNNTPDICNETYWGNSTITLSPDGKTMKVYYSTATDGNNYTTYTRQ